MLTCKSPRKVMRAAHHLGRRCLRKYSSKFSRHDYTLPQLFACLVVREQMRLSYRGAEALLRDGRAWCRAIGIRRRTPDHATLARAASAILTGRRVGRMLDLLAGWFMLARKLGTTLAVDSTLYDTHHRSRHYERRLRHYGVGGRADGSGDVRRSASARRTPKLSVGVDTRSHVILSASARAGMGSDAPAFDRLLYDAWRRRGGRVRCVLADAGFDCEANHRIARLDMGVRSLIKAGVGRPTATPGKPPAGRYRRRMARELAGPQKGRPFGQRAQAETVMSMLKRNLGDALRARSPRARRREHAFKAVVHDLMLTRPQLPGSRQSRYVPVSCPSPFHARPRERQQPAAGRGRPERGAGQPDRAGRAGHVDLCRQRRGRRRTDEPRHEGLRDAARPADHRRRRRRGGGRPADDLVRQSLCQLGRPGA
jgi:hypothetical protein